MNFEERMLLGKSSPEELERLYREDQNRFREVFDQLFKENPYDTILTVWYQRLYFSRKSRPGNAQLFLWAIPLAILASLLTRWLWEMRLEAFYVDAFLVFPTVLAMGIYFSLERGHSWKMRLFSGALFLLLAAGVWFLSQNLGEPWFDHKKLVLNLMIPVVLVFFLGFLYTGVEGRHPGPRLDFIKACATGVIFALPLVLAGLLLLALGVFLFRLLGYEVMYMTAGVSTVLVGASLIPVVAAHLVETHGSMLRNLMALLAKLFTPLIFLALVGFLVVAGIQGQNALADRDFLLVINGSLALVLVLTLFSLSELRGQQRPGAGDVLLFGLLILGIAIDILALVAGLYRITTLDFTPVKLMVLGFNVAVLGNFLWVGLGFLRFLMGRDSITQAQKSLAAYLPVYLIWALVSLGLTPLF